MSAFPRARLPARFSFSALAVLALSILLHAVTLRTVSTLGDAGKDGEPARAPDTVVVQLSPQAEPAALPVPRVRPPKKPRPARPKQGPVATPVPQPELASSAPVPSGPQDQSAEVAPEIAPAPDLAEMVNDGLPADEAPLAAVPDLDALQPTYLADAPPPAELRYAVKAIREGESYHGRGKIQFVREQGTYTIIGEAKLLFISVLDFRSNGVIGERGLDPAMYTEKRFRRPATNTHFQRERSLISFSASTKTYPRQGGEQDRASVVWQLAAIGRGEPSQLAAGQQLTLFVAGVRDGEPWILRVIGEEALEVDGKPVQAVHVVRSPRPGSYEQKLDIWLAPTMQWYPVKLLFTETSGEYLDMSLSEPPLALPRP
ncbi:DUF3108 domain-containing protein [Lacisediminimonas profundi]|uniref:DUF3108 domain-containing protein n=1 Tax=Lacisediminimonas profundi TaxID=2603856 RepID=UPI00124B1C74|nr:DUF3108 domain-containing protein [Lacisediminimonas profundi]